MGQSSQYTTTMLSLLVILLSSIALVQGQGEDIRSDEEQAKAYLQTFIALCNSDGDDGLSWAEVENCLKTNAEYFQEQSSTIGVANQERFNLFDLDKNGVLTIQEAFVALTGRK